MRQLRFFDNVPALQAPEKEGIKYTGSKLKLIPYILHLARKVEAHTVLDAFSGTTRVSQAFAKSGYRVLCNDIAIWSEVFGTCYLLNKKRPEEYQPLIDHLNSLPPIDGWFTQMYGGQPNGGCAVQPDGLKRPWQIHNTRKLYAIRQEIEKLELDKVDNTLGHFVSYLREWSPRSYNNLVLKVPALFLTSEEHQVFREDVFDLLPRVSVDLAYFDPPYGSNNDKMPPSRVRYASYYHIWTTICLFDKPDVFGKSRRRKDTSDVIATSVFEEYRRGSDGRYLVVSAIERLIREVNAKWVILSYSSDGRATAEELDEVIRRNGKLIEVLEIDYKSNVMKSMRWTNEWLRDVEKPHQEFLFLIEK